MVGAKLRRPCSNTQSVSQSATHPSIHPSVHPSISPPVRPTISVAVVMLIDDDVDRNDSKCARVCAWPAFCLHSGEIVIIMVSLQAVSRSKSVVKVPVLMAR